MVPYFLSNKNLGAPLFVLAMLVLLSSCAPYQARKTTPRYHAVGMASWYGPGFHGRKTSSGESYNQRDMTAAHRTLPFGSTIKVTNIDNGKACVVRINDRGPFIRGRIIDLSKAAAAEIDMIGTGTARVELASLNGSRQKEVDPSEDTEIQMPSRKQKKNSKKSRFVPPPPPPSEPPPKHKIITTSPPDNDATEGLNDIRQDIREKTGMPEAQDRF